MGLVYTRWPIILHAETVLPTIITINNFIACTYLVQKIKEH